VGYRTFVAQDINDGLKRYYGKGNSAVVAKVFNITVLQICKASTNKRLRNDARKFLSKSR